MKSDSLSSTSESGSESSDDATEVPPDEAAKVPLARHGRDFEQGQHWFSVSERLRKLVVLALMSVDCRLCYLLGTAFYVDAVYTSIM